MLAKLARFSSGILVAATLSGSAGAQDDLRFIMVTHGAPSNAFWATVKEGAEIAAEKAGVAFEYRAPETFDLQAMAALIDAAVAEAPDGLIVSIPNADAVVGPVQAAIAAGIPVISINSGFDVSRPMGALLHVGQGEYEAGRVAGEAMRSRGGANALCLNHEVGNVALDLRCKGFIDGFGGSVSVLPVEDGPAATQQAVGEALAGDGGIDVVLALSASLGGEPAVAAIEALEDGRSIHVGSFDVSDTLLAAVADGKAAFVIDQQPFLQGYLPVEFLAVYLRHGFIPVSHVSTGPKLVEAGEAARRLGRAAGEGAGAPLEPAGQEGG
jgi:simple sugar transport system substrate-binding protein